MRGLLLFLVGITALFGCSVSVTTGPPSEYDSAAALTTLDTVLSAWKGGKAGTLARQKPPIRFVDDDLRTGHQLQSYEIVQPTGLLKEFQNIRVKLTVKRGGGVAINKEADYQVSLKPSLAVLRSDQ